MPISAINDHIIDESVGAVGVEEIKYPDSTSYDANFFTVQGKRIIGANTD